MRTKQAGIYCIENLDNGKRYVGSTNYMIHRRAQHLCDLRAGRHSNGFLQNAYKAHGPERFAFVVLEYCAIGELLKREAWWIDLFRSDNPDLGYNMIPAATSPRLGRKHSAEAKAKMSARKKGKPGNWIGRHHSDVSKERIRQAHLGRSRPVRSESDPRTKSCEVIDPQGRVSLIRNLKSFCREQGLSYSYMAKIASGRHPASWRHRGYQARYVA